MCLNSVSPILSVLRFCRFCPDNDIERGEENIKNKIESFYKKSSNINIVINMSSSKSTDTIPVKIYGIYPNIFCVEEAETQCPKKYSFQYVDVLIGRVVIKELPISKENSTKKRIKN